MTHLEVLDNEHLGKDEEEGPADDNEEIPSPQIMDIQRVRGLDVIRSADGAGSRLSPVKSARQVGSNGNGVLVNSGAVTWNDKGALAN